MLYVWKTQKKAMLDDVERVGTVIMQNIDADPRKVFDDWISDKSKCPLEALQAASEVCKNFKTSHDITLRTP